MCWLLFVLLTVVLWGPISLFVIFEHKILVFCSGNFPMCLWVWGSSLISLPLDSVYFFLMRRSLIHLDLGFVQGDKNKSICILLHTDHQMNQQHMLKMLFFSPLDFSSFIKDRMAICVRLHFWGFNYVPLIYLPNFLPIPNRFHL